MPLSIGSTCSSSSTNNFKGQPFTARPLPRKLTLKKLSRINDNRSSQSKSAHTWDGSKIAGWPLKRSLTGRPSSMCTSCSVARLCVVLPSGKACMTSACNLQQESNNGRPYRMGEPYSRSRFYASSRCYTLFTYFTSYNFNIRMKSSFNVVVQQHMICLQTML